jgi:hypothetical protein
MSKAFLWSHQNPPLFFFRIKIPLEFSSGLKSWRKWDCWASPYSKSSQCTFEFVHSDHQQQWYPSCWHNPIYNYKHGVCLSVCPSFTYLLLISFSLTSFCQRNDRNSPLFIGPSFVA